MHFMDTTSTNQDVLTLFHPFISEWFKNQVGNPTDIQQKSWPVIADNKHCLITAPTGSGKTLTAFLWAINQWATGQYETGQTSVLYISPLKALNNDIRTNLIHPLYQLNSLFHEKNQSFPQIRTFTRSGDTPQNERRAMLRHPPEILITTPESLNLMLSSKSGQAALQTIKTVILDEIHGIYPEKRGTYLISAVERLSLLSGEFQRIGLSATINPLTEVARFLGGYQLEQSNDTFKYIPRDVTILKSSEEKKLQIQIQYPGPPKDYSSEDATWEPLIEAFHPVIDKNRSTLLFTNSRRLCERIALKLNIEQDEPIAYAHHGSLSKEIRQEVEKNLKDGKLKAIVATNSLEMGIDIGHLDEVLLIQTPPSISSAVQRIGRAGHQVSEISKGTLFPTHRHDFLEAAVIALSVSKKDIEPQTTPKAPLDVLAQIIISMTGIESWLVDDLYHFIRACSPFHSLSREHFDLVLDMLNGRYESTRIRELKARIHWDRIDNRINASRGALFHLYTSGGMIPERGAYNLKHQQSRARIGDLDEEFVWEARIGQTFTLGTQHWRIENITHNDVLVSPGNPNKTDTPFWKAEPRNRNPHFSIRLSEFLEKANADLQQPEFMEYLQTDCKMELSAAEHLVEYLKDQKSRSGCDLPHRHHIVIEHVQTGPGGVPGNQLILHTFWGGSLNRPLAHAIQSAWQEKHGQLLEVFPTNDAVIIQLSASISADQLFSLVHPEKIESLLYKSLEGTGYFGARFRECAGRALLISRNRMGSRMPLWMLRLRSQKLLDGVQSFHDFPILLETWRSLLQDDFNLPLLKKRLAEIRTGDIQITEITQEGQTPFTSNLTWPQINQYMYENDESRSAQSSLVRRDLFEDLLATPDLRPAIPESIIQTFEEKRQRIYSGYSPWTSLELIEWLKERILLTKLEWNNLTRAIERDHPSEYNSIIQKCGLKIARIQFSDQSTLYAALERIPEIIAVFYPSQPDIKIVTIDSDQTVQYSELDIQDKDETLFRFVQEYLSYYGPVKVNELTSRLRLDQTVVRQILEDLLESEQIISGKLIENRDDIYFCDRENYEILLRVSRKQRIPVFEPHPIENLPLFLASYQSITSKQKADDQIIQSVEQLMGHWASPHLWETAIFSARIKSSPLSHLDTELQSNDVRWLGNDKKQITFTFEADRDLLFNDITPDEKDDDSTQEELFKDKLARYSFSSILQTSGISPNLLTEKLWDLVWQGLITNDSLETLRKGIQHQFRFPDTVSDFQRRHSVRGKRTLSRRGFSQWQSAIPNTGNWYLLEDIQFPENELDKLEIEKDRARLLLERYGILFRELLLREQPPFQWKDIFHALRLMELSGEILSGYFFENIPGPQFISHAAFRMLQQPLPEETIFWIHAQDPASCCGLGIPLIYHSLPQRRDNIWIVYHGKKVVLIAERNGKSLTIHASENSLHLKEYFQIFHHLLNRPFQPLSKIVIEKINEDQADRSPYLPAFKSQFDVSVDYQKIILYNKVT